MTVEWTSAGLFGEFFSDEYGVVLSNRARRAPAILATLPVLKNLERAQESDQHVSLTWREPPEIVRSILSFIFVTLDGILKRQ